MRIAVRPTHRRTVSRSMLGSIAAVATLTVTARATPPPRSIQLNPIGTHATGVFDQSAAEIPAYDPATRRLFVVNAQAAGIDVLDISNPAAPVSLGSIDLKPYGNVVNSVDVRDGIVAVAVENAVKTNPGTVAFFRASDGAVLSTVTVGALPDMLTFTPNGRFVLVANEGEPNDAYTVDPEGSISVIDMSGGALHVTQADVRTADFTAFNGVALDPSIRIYGPGATVAQDIEPEFITVSHDSRTAWVSLQENNALAVIDINAASVDSLIGLGFKNHDLLGQGLDASDSDSTVNGGINILNWPVHGMYQPDGIASYRVGGNTYIVTANEGDTRSYTGFDEVRRVSSLTLDPAVFPNFATLQLPAKLGRLNVTRANGNTDADAQFERLFSFGTRSFSIWTADGRQVFDSGDDFEQITATALPSRFNANHTSNSKDNRSDDKGPEPEGVAIGKAYGRTYAFIGLERIGGIMVYDISDPFSPSFVQYVNTRNFSQTPGPNSGGDLGPEGVIFIKADDSPIGKPLLVVAHEVSGTTRVFEVNAVQ